MKWSNPYYGISHLCNVAKGKGQVTISQHDGWVHAYVVAPNSFRSLAEAVVDTAEEARAWSERKASELGMLTP